MFVSVVIPTYNRRPILEKCLSALEQQHTAGTAVERFEVVVVDDKFGLKITEIVDSPS